MMVFVFESQYLRSGDVLKSGYNGIDLKSDVSWIHDLWFKILPSPFKILIYLINRFS